MSAGRVNDGVYTHGNLTLDLRIAHQRSADRSSSGGGDVLQGSCYEECSEAVKRRKRDSARIDASNGSRIPEMLDEIRIHSVTAESRAGRIQYAELHEHRKK